MGLIENIERRIEYGQPCMNRLSDLTIKEIVSSIEKIWENSGANSKSVYGNCTEELEKEYLNKSTYVNYDKDLKISKVEVRWSYWDGISIELTSMGLIAKFKPEHGPTQTLLDLTWVLIEPFFFKN